MTMFFVNGKRRYLQQNEQHSLLMDFVERDVFEDCQKSNGEIKVHLPIPFHKPFPILKDDVLLELPKAKAKYKEEQAKCQVIYTKYKQNIIRERFGKTEYLHIPKGLLRFYQMKDPDPMFDFDYNAYYTGGFLECCSIDGKTGLIRPNCKNNLCVTFLNKSKKTHKIPFKTKTSIYNILATEHYLATREKNCISIIEINDLKEVNLKHTIEHKLGFFDAKMHKDETKLGTLTTDLRLQVTDLTTGKHMRTFACNKDKFGQFTFADTNTFYAVTGREIYLFDLRSRDRNVHDLKLSDCNPLCNLVLYNNDLFLSSRHYLLKADTRDFENVDYYSHALNSMPCYLQVLPEKCLVCCAGQKETQKCLYTGLPLPLSMPSLKRTLRECRLRKDILLNFTVDERIDYSIAGLKLVLEDDEPVVYYSNSLGEIFRQQIGRSTDDWDDVIEKSSELMQEWVENLPKKTPVVNATNIAEAGRLRFALTRVEPTRKAFTAPGNAGKFLEDYGKKYDVDNMDGLAKEFMKVWFEDEEREDDREKIAPEEPYFSKVHNWIQGQEFNDNSFHSFFESDHSNL